MKLQTGHWKDRRVHVNFCKIDIGKIMESILCFRWCVRLSSQQYSYCSSLLQNVDEHGNVMYELKVNVTSETTR